MNEKPEKLIDKKGIRLDGRKADELRPLKLQVGVLGNADGSAYVEHGKNKILAAAFGPREMPLSHGSLFSSGTKISCTFQKRSRAL
jgi:exosome complex component RRP41